MPEKAELEKEEDRRPLPAARCPSPFPAPRSSAADRRRFSPTTLFSSVSSPSGMGPAARRRSPEERRLLDRKPSSPRRSSPSRRDRRASPERKSSARNYSLHQNRSPRRERSRSPARERRSPKRGRSRSPLRERIPYPSRSPQRRKSRSPRSRRPEEEVKPPTRDSSSRSPSPRTKRLMRAETDRKVSRVSNVEEGRDDAREDKRRNKERERRSPRHRSISPEESDRKRKRRSSSPSQARGPEEHRDEDDSVAKMKAAEEALLEKQKQKPSFELSGKLAEETNRVRGVTLLFTEPADARQPNVRWRLYVFKGGEVLNEPLYVHRQSCYLFGRERRVADIPTDHPSCSKQHAVLQFRLVETERADGLLSKNVRPYIMDLGSTNGTFLNDERIEPQRYYELKEKDVVKFGNSSREYVILHENSVK